MKSRLFMLINTCLCALAFGAGAKVPPPVDEVSQASIQAAFQILRRDYIRREDLTFDQLNRAALHGLLERLDFGAELVKDNPAAPAADTHLVADSLTNDIAYMRPGTFEAKEMGPIEGKLNEFKGKGSKHLILDLRAPMQPGEFENAAALLELFVPKGLLLFKLKQLGAGEAQLLLSRRDPVWSGTLLVLIDQDTNNLGETVAAVLHDQRRALLVGASTRGATVRYETVPLDDGWKLRFARAEVLLPDDSSVFRKGVKPDMPLAFSAKDKGAVFKAKTIKTVVFEEARPRFNEAALVANRNPELDDYIRRSSGEVMTYDKPAPHDTVLQRAVDLLLSSDHFAASKLDWKKPGPEPATPAVPKAVPVNP